MKGIEWETKKLIQTSREKVVDYMRLILQPPKAPLK